MPNNGDPSEKWSSGSEDETLPFAPEARPASSHVSKPVRVDRKSLPGKISALVDVLSELQLITPTQLGELGAMLPELQDANAFITEIERRGWLTAYQAELLRNNRSKQLVFGSYVLLEPIGKGGMGQVFKARHRVMKRLVALKIIRKGHLPHGEAIQRFTQEIESAAKLAHPNIVTSHDAGRAGDYHYFIMELVDGVNLDTLRRRQGPLPVGLACDLIRQTALGLQHAHEQGLVHRDIKPQNLILDSRGTVKVLDMGLARVQYDPAGAGSKALTQMGTIMGTADFIAPEQILDCSRVDGRADIYSLGCTFYQLLTGAVLYPGNDLRKKLEQHTRGEPPSVRSLRADVPEDLAAILGKMLARRPADRFNCAADVAQALAPFCSPTSIPTARIVPDDTELTNQQGAPKTLSDATPADVRVDTPATLKDNPPRRMAGIFHKRPLIVVGALGLIIVLAACYLLTPSRLAPSQEPASLLDALQAKDIPPSLRAELPEDVLAVLGDARVNTGSNGGITFLAVSADEKLVALNTSNTHLYIVNVTDLRELRTISCPIPIAAISFSRDNTRIAGGNPLCLWDVHSGQKIWQSSQLIGKLAPTSVAFTHTGDKILTAAPGEPLRMWNAEDGSFIQEFTSRGKDLGLVALAPDGKTFLSSEIMTECHAVFRNLSDPDFETKGDTPLPGTTTCMAFSRDGKLAATGDASGHVSIWDVATGRRIALRGIGYTARITTVNFLPWGPLLATSSMGSLHSWNEQLDSLGKKKLDPMDSLSHAVLIDGGTRLLVSDNKTVRTFDTSTGDEVPAAAPESSSLACLAFSPDGKHLLIGNFNTGIRIWDLQKLCTVRLIPERNEIWSLFLRPDGKKVAHVHSQGLRTWDFATGTPWFPQCPAWGHAGKFTPDGLGILIGQRGGFQLIDSNGKIVAEGKTSNSVVVSSLDVAKDGSWAVVSSAYHQGPKPAAIDFFETSTGRRIRSHEFAKNGFWNIRLSPDNRYLYGGEENGNKLLIWEITSDKNLKTLREVPAHRGPMYGMALSPDGQTLVTQAGSTVTQWSVPAGDKIKEWDIPGIPEARVGIVTFAPDNRHIAVGRSDGRALILRLARK